MHKGKRRWIWIVLIVLTMTAAGCGKAQEEKAEQKEVVKVMPGAYDSTDTAMIEAKNTTKKTITFYNFELKKNYTLGYDGTTEFVDKYGTPIAPAQLKEGEMVDVYFLKGEKMISKAAVSDKIWTMAEVKQFELDLKAGRIKLMEEYYTLNEDTIILSGKEKVDYIDINQEDTITIKGRGRQIYSITIDEGHGYLRLENDEYFVGGWIEVGRNIVRKIEQEMLLAIPEGTHKVYVSHTGIEGEKEVTITRGKESQLDLGDLKKDDLVKYGNLIFTVEPSDAQVLLDGKEVDITRAVKAEYGLHQITVKKEGYDTVIQYIRVSEEGANLSITLDKEKEKQKTVSSNSTSAVTPTPLPTVSANKTNTSGTEASTTGYKIEIKAPEGAQVFVDGSYVGIAPVSFRKEKGKYQITLRKSGYETATYPIEVDDANKDRQYSFSELISVSANSVNN